MINAIPKIIHQTWKTDELPYPFNLLADTWKELHPDHEYKLWTDTMIREFIEEHFPVFLAKYDRYPRHIQRIDAFRYFLLLKEGGMYIDIDFECLTNISVLLQNTSCVIGKEPQIHCDRFAQQMILCNAFMASTPGNAFMEFVCQKMIDHPLAAVQTPR
ncbi:MAG TPA: glycosyltransferase, partial [Niastella sp.]